MEWLVSTQQLLPPLARISYWYMSRDMSFPTLRFTFLCSFFAVLRLFWQPYPTLSFYKAVPFRLFLFRLGSAQLLKSYFVWLLVEHHPLSVECSSGYFSWITPLQCCASIACVSGTSAQVSLILSHISKKWSFDDLSSVKSCQKLRLMSNVYEKWCLHQ